jgi:hypothetical protein
MNSPPTSLQQRLVKTGGRLVKHARYYWLLLAEVGCEKIGSIERQVYSFCASEVNGISGPKSNQRGGDYEVPS